MGGRSATPPTEALEPATERGARPSLTARAIALAVVLLVLTISYANSLRIYFAQAQDISASKAAIAQRQQSITDLQGQITQWGDETYLRTQARERLGWVVPGETAFQVVGPDGKPLGGGAEIASDTAAVAKPQDVWWAKLWGSVEAADRPAPVKVKPTPQKPITEHTKPNDAKPTPTLTPTPTQSPAPTPAATPKPSPTKR